MLVRIWILLLRLLCSLFQDKKAILLETCMLKLILLVSKEYWLLILIWILLRIISLIVRMLLSFFCFRILFYLYFFIYCSFYILNPSYSVAKKYHNVIISIVPVIIENQMFGCIIKSNVIIEYPNSNPQLLILYSKE